MLRFKAGKKTGILLLCLVGWLAGCNQKQIQWAGNYLVTFYFVSPRNVPEKEMAFRIQDREYRILTGLPVILKVVDPAVVIPILVPLKPGAGKDYRGLYRFQSGDYQLQLLFADSAGQTVTALFQCQFPGRVNKR